MNKTSKHWRAKQQNCPSFKNCPEFLKEDPLVRIWPSCSSQITPGMSPFTSWTLHEEISYNYFLDKPLLWHWVKLDIEQITLQLNIGKLTTDKTVLVPNMHFHTVVSSHMSTQVRYVTSSSPATSPLTCFSSDKKTSQIRPGPTHSNCHQHQRTSLPPPSTSLPEEGTQLSLSHSVEGCLFCAICFPFPINRGYTTRRRPFVPGPGVTCQPHSPRLSTPYPPNPLRRLIPPSLPSDDAMVGRGELESEVNIVINLPKDSKWVSAFNYLRMSANWRGGT